MSSFGGPRLILTVPGGGSRPNKTSSVKKSKFSKLSLMPFCQITAELMNKIIKQSRAKLEKTRAVQKIPVKICMNMHKPALKQWRLLQFRNRLQFAW